MQEQETAVEMGLKEMLAEAVDALMLHRSYQQGAIDSCVVAGLTDPTAERRKLDAIKAALAYFERLAEHEVVRVPCEDDDGRLESVGFHIAGRFPDFSTDCSAGGNGKWYILGAQHEPIERRAMLHLAAALECRKRNGGMG